MQVKLLRAIQERVVRKVGGTEDIRVDVRIIAATNRDLEAGVAKGTFREDLYYRLNVILIRTPPLRERKGDVQLLAEHFLRRYSEAQGKPVETLAPEALLALEGYPWPGNIRELENVMQRAVTLSTTGQLELDALPGAIQESYKGVAGRAAAAQAANATGLTSDPAPVAEIRLPAPDFGRGPVDFEGIVSDVEKAYILAALEHAQGNRRAAETCSSSMPGACGTA